MSLSLAIVDDSRFMRMMLRKMMASDPEINIIGEAANGPDAIKLVNEKRPEVVTLDLQMPGMDGLTVLARVMKEVPTTRVVVISAFTKEGAEASAEALKRGALGMVQKPSGTASADVEKMKIDLLHTIREAAKAPLHREVKITDDMLTKSSVKLKEDAANPAKRIVVIGASMGGPTVVRRIVSMLPETLDAAVIIAQQTQNKFTRLLMKEIPGLLDESTALTVNIANEGDVLCNGQVTFTPEGFDVVVAKEGDYITVHKQPVAQGAAVDVDKLMKTVAEACGPMCIGVILSGDVKVGADGMHAIKQAGGMTIAQDPKSSAFPQMPKAAVDAGTTDYVLKTEDIGAKIIELVGKLGTPSSA